MLFVASPLSTQWSASLLGGGHFQERNDIDGDGWADLPGYQRGVVRPRFFWDGDGGRTAMISGGVTYEDRSAWWHDLRRAIPRGPRHATV